ncbi:hypothetical protein GCM10023350_11480 [Nocardioides endophyticus]|uniref:HTH tetR-type domain-containing protein n=1 Tax=Nocardioides endophyticus TaxID=1353775 RepID=A0ABP8YIM5_9ACTN
MTARELEPREGARLRASERCCALFSARGTTDLTIAEIVSEIGISQRTFHRYFPIKAESVGPVFDWSIRRSNAVIVEADPNLALTEVLRRAFRASLLGESAERTRQLFPLVFRDSEMWSVFIRKVHDGELSVAPLLAPRLGLAADSIAARAAAAAVTSSIRIALEHMVTADADPETAYVQTLAQFTSGALVAAQAASQRMSGTPPHTNPTGRYEPNALIEQH